MEFFAHLFVAALLAVLVVLLAAVVLPLVGMAIIFLRDIYRELQS